MTRAGSQDTERRGAASVLRALPNPYRALRDTLTHLEARGCRRSDLFAVTVLWPIATALAWGLTHPDPSVLAEHGHALLMDGHAYWSVWQRDLYSLPPRAIDAYLYSPAFAQLLWPLTTLSFGAFAVIWWGAIVIAFWWLLRPLPWSWRLPALVVTGFELQVGNINAFLAVMIVLAARRPGLWTLALLTKLTPAVGLLWFVVRRDWHALREVAVVTAIVVAVSAAAGPELWLAWWEFLRHESRGNGGTSALDAASVPVRLACAVVLVVWGARTGRQWVLPVAVVLASPLLGLASISLLAALPRMCMQSPGTSEDDPMEAASTGGRRLADPAPAPAAVPAPRAALAAPVPSRRRSPARPGGAMSGPTPEADRSSQETVDRDGAGEWRSSRGR